MFSITARHFLLWLLFFIQSTEEKSSKSKKSSCVIEEELTLKSAQKMLKTLKISNNSTSLKEARNFADKINEIDLLLSNEFQVAVFEYFTNMTDCKKTIQEKKKEKYKNFLMEADEMAKKFKWKNFKKKNGTLYRWFKLFLITPDFDLRRLKMKLVSSGDNKQETMDEIFEKARVCPYGAEGNKAKCTLELDPDIKLIMQTSRDPKELESMWTQFKTETGVKMRPIFLQTVKEMNKYAKKEGFKDYGEVFRQEYEDKNFAGDMQKIFDEILPLYQQLHAFVRKKLMSYYKDVRIKNDGPIPSHLFGEMQASDWKGIFPIMNPFKKKKLPNVTETMLEMKMKPLDMFIMAEDVFVSLGLKRMSPYFWKYSMFVEPEDREVQCRPMSFDMMDGKDYRVKMCTTVDSASLHSIYHEMGHTEYQMFYSHHPSVFRYGANPGFHEAIGEVIDLSALTLEHLEETLFKGTKKYKGDKETEISRLLKLGMKYIPLAVYAFTVDTYRYKIFNGTVTDDDLNLGWWAERLKYQGVCPPVKRIEKHFDAGSIFHVAYNSEMMRYSFSNVLAFQILKSLCEEIRYKGPLHKCDLYNQKKAGALLKKVLSLGKTKHWRAAMKILTKNKTSSLKSGPLLEYFKPLYNWLKKQNEGQNIGWKSTNPMECP